MILRNPRLACLRAGCVAVPITGPKITVWVPETSSTSCDQAIFVDYAADASVPSEAVLLEVYRVG